MKIRAIFAYAVCWLAFAVTGQSAQNLVLNAGCETLGTPPPSWTQVTGNWVCTVYVPQQEGSFHFVAGANASAELRQDVSVSSFATIIDAGQEEAAFSGHIRSYPQTPADLSRIVLEYRDAANTSVLASFDSGNLSSVGSWKPVAHTKKIPSGTRTIRIRLISTRSPGGADNDGYYDALSLTVAGVTCHSDADCHLQSCDYDCSCLALLPGEQPSKKCNAQSACVVDPCRDKVAACVEGKCVLDGV